MLIATVKSNFEPQLKSLAQDSKVVAAVSSELQPALKSPGQQTLVVGLASPLVLSSQLPSGVQLPTTKRAAESDYEAVKIVAQELLLPAVSTIWPGAKPYVTGVQAIWATVEFWQAITDEEVDSTKRTIKGVRAAQKAVNALLTFQNAPPLATGINTVAGYMIATADKLYVVREKAEQQGGSNQANQSK